jgi:NAD(P)-dependent dehydrogenase (short-subunit alcohol dehydrogenase family)
MSLTLLSQKWNPPYDSTKSFAKKTVIVTGSSSGLGYEAALKFARNGASKLILAVRNVAKGQAAKEAIVSEVGEGSQATIEVWELEMGDYKSIKSFANRVEGLEKLDVVILNAGVIAKAFRKEKYGWEATLQINTLSTSLLALLLLPKLRKSKSRDWTPVLEIVSSGLYPDAQAPVDGPLEHWNKPEGYEYQKQYNVSKLFVQCAIQALSKMTQPTPDSPPEVIVLGVCPGACASDLARDLLDNLFMRVFAAIYFALFFRTAEQGSRAFVSGVLQGPGSNGGFWKEDILQP